MGNELMLQELDDEQLELVTGGHGHGHSHGNVTNNVHVTIIENQYNIVYAPVYIFGTVIDSNIDNGNTYVQGNSFGHSQP